MSADFAPGSSSSRESASADEPGTRLNIFALPSRTTLLFALIVLVIALPLLAALGGGSPICAPFLIFWMLLLPLRDFLRRPTQTIQADALKDAGGAFPILSKRWNELATSVAKIKPPRLLVTQRQSDVFTFGSFTRRYAALAQATAAALEQDLGSAQEAAARRSAAVLLHELAHFLHHDVGMALFSHSLLRVTIVFMFLNLIANALTPFLYNSIVSFFDFSKLWSPEMMQLMTALNPDQMSALLHPPLIAPEVWLRYEAFVLSAHGPLIVGGGVLLIFYWRALLRTRELYADARVAQWLDPPTMEHQLLYAQVTQTMQPPRANQGRGFFTRGINMPGRQKIQGWLGTHPSLATRRECLRAPHKIYGSDSAIAVTAGAAVVLLNLMLGSLFLSRYIRGPNSGVPFVIGFMVIALSLSPRLCQFPERRREYASQLTKIVLIFTAIKLVPQYIAGLGLTAALIAAPGLLDQSAYTLVPGAGAHPPPLGIPLEFVLEVFVIRPALLFTFVMPLVLILWLGIDGWLKRRLLRWHASNFMQRHPAWLLWSVTALLALVLGSLLLPILDALTIPTAHDLSDPGTLVEIFFGLALLACGGVVFLFNDRRHLDRCPQCGARDTGAYRLGKRCAACGTLFHPQLCSTSGISRPVISLTNNPT